MEIHTVFHAIIVNKQNKVLIVKRAPNVEIYSSLWSIPGGHIKANETFEECLKREIKEELGANVTKVIKAISPYKRKLDNSYWKVKLYVITIDKLKLNKKELMDFKWINPKDIFLFNTTPFLDFHFHKSGLL